MCRHFTGVITARRRKELERLQRHGGAGQPAYETSRKRRDGSALDLRFWSNPIHDVDGRPAGFLVLAEDVTREQHLAQERARLATAIDQTADSVVVADSKAHILYVNPAFERVTGYTRDEVLGKNPRILQSGTMPRSFYDDMWAVLSAGRTWVGEFANRRKDGSIFPEEATISPISDEKGYVTGYVAVGRDLTVQRQADAARRESEKGYRSLFDNMHEGVAYCEMTYVDGQPDDFTYLDVNRAFSEQTGLDDVIGKRVSEVVPGIRESDPELLEAYGRVAAGGRSEHFENHVPPLDMWLAVSVYCPEPGRFIAVFDVITERVKAEHALRAANTLLERTEAIAHVGSWRLDVSSGSVSWSAEMYRIFGLDPSEPALTATEILARAIHPDDRHIMAAAQGAFGIGEVRPLDLRIVLPGGEVRVVHMDGEVQNDDQGRPVALFGFAQDVTASRHS